MKCAWRRCSEEVIGRKNKRFCTKKCSVKHHVARNRTEYKIRAVELFGGKCSRCGYNVCIRALQFHHVDPTLKRFGIAEKGFTRFWEKYKEELQKCILLCANCHAEEEHRLLGCGSTGTADDCYSSSAKAH